MVSTGYLACWFANLFEFRRRSFVERIFWSIPASTAVSTIAAVALTWILSLAAAEWFFLICGSLWIAVLLSEYLRLRQSNRTWNIGWNPLGTSTVLLALVYCVLGVLSLIDIQRDHELFMSMSVYDQGARANWTDAILRSGVPPANPLFLFKHPVPMRNYYFWYVLCAAVVRMVHVSSRSALIASCVWSGFGMAALAGLYLKQFLFAGKRLRRTFLAAAMLVCVGGLDILLHCWNFFYLHVPLFDRPAMWTQLNCWFITFSLDPHHLTSVTCCMFGFLIAWIAAENESSFAFPVALIATAFASSVGLSAFDSLAFALISAAWIVWQIVFERRFRAPMLLLCAAALGALLVSPYIWSLFHTPSGIEGSGSAFGLGVRETFPSESWSAGFFRGFASSHHEMAKSFRNLVLLPPGLMLELGFYFFVLLIYLIPPLRARKPLSAERRSLVFIAVASIVVSSFLGSFVLNYNNFGVLSGLFAQFSLLLLGSEVVDAWKDREVLDSEAEDPARLHDFVPPWLRAITAFALILGFLSTIYYSLMFRFITPLTEAAHKRAVHDLIAGNLSHDAYISYFGYRKLNASIPVNAVVQFNPSYHNEYWSVVELIGVNHQTAIGGDRSWCGAVLGGDPRGCAVMGPPIAGLYKTATAQGAHEVCSAFGIQYLVATIYDPIWNDRDSWVWQLPPVVQEPEFRAVDCREQIQSPPESHQSRPVAQPQAQ